MQNLPSIYQLGSDFVKQLFRIQIQKVGKALLWNQVKSGMEACYSVLILICLYFSRDFLTIYDGSSNTSSAFGQYCGNSIPQSRISSTNEVYIFFQSDGKDHNANEISGFQINYRTYSKFCILMIKFSFIYDLFYRQDSVIRMLFSWTNGR